MARFHLGLFTVLAAAVLLTLAAPMAAAASPTDAAAPPTVTPPVSRPTSGVTVDAPKHAQRDRLTAVTVNLPLKVAAVEGRLLVAQGLRGADGRRSGQGQRASSVVGQGRLRVRRLQPRRPSSGHNALQLVVLPHRTGSAPVPRRDRFGGRSLRVTRVALSTTATSSVPSRRRQQAVRRARFYAAPPDLDAAHARSSLPGRAGPSAHRPRHEDHADGPRPGPLRLDDDACAEQRAAAASPPVTSTRDGCVDAVDLQATVAALASEGKTQRGPRRVIRRSASTASAITPIPGRTFTVNSTADTPDANRRRRRLRQLAGSLHASRRDPGSRLGRRRRPDRLQHPRRGRPGDPAQRVACR